MGIDIVPPFSATVQHLASPQAIHKCEAKGGTISMPTGRHVDNL